MTGWFELDYSINGQYRFTLKAANAETILSSENYISKDAAEDGIASVQKNALLNERYERETSMNGRPYFNLKAGNHQIIGTSQMYASEQARDAGIASVKTHGASGTIKDRTA
ncbi:hypothetical protein DBR37_02775 [Herminiimonas sp. KBW02]|uniref:YegP family protein n=1 Tax=Herminiimonas sp. KBW02 TaxID=2153363 RepID=UPI000F5A4866|nr:YegP family protein [Herminiimonas sp. KBW02]RQO37129.1 hypothetical protein DBR37_02775 [Herminiimonas sp. KBW02]